MKTFKPEYYLYINGHRFLGDSSGIDACQLIDQNINWPINLLVEESNMT